jgi:hypothetical protein
MLPTNLIIPRPRNGPREIRLFSPFVIRSGLSRKAAGVAVSLILYLFHKPRGPLNICGTYLQSFPGVVLGTERVVVPIIQG